VGENSVVKPLTKRVKKMLYNRNILNERLVRMIADMGIKNIELLVYCGIYLHNSPKFLNKLFLLRLSNAEDRDELLTTIFGLIPAFKPD
jgi:hypothetical protein